MGAKSNIEWTDASYTPIRARNLKTGKIGWYCEHSTTGCEFCYSEGFNLRLGTGLPFKPGHRKDVEIFLDEEMLLAPLRWKKPRMIFVCSMTDLFADFVKDEWIDRVFAVMALAPQHTFQVLTKRAERMRRYVTREARERIVALMWQLSQHRTDHIHGGWPLRNVWLGVSAERQQEADERIPHLLQTPAAIRFVSAEPLLGPIDLSTINTCSPGYSTTMGANLGWVIVGGESGHNARPMHPDWALSLRDQCKAAGVEYFFKQWGEWLPWSHFVGAGVNDHPEQTKFLTQEFENGRWRDVGYPMWCDSTDGNIDAEYCVGRVGKKAAGRLLDGIEHNAMPERVTA